jgi:hypothetical protein
LQPPLVRGKHLKLGEWLVAWQHALDQDCLLLMQLFVLQQLAFLEVVFSSEGAEEVWQGLMFAEVH